MQQLENKSESSDFDQELQSDLAVVNDAQERMSRGFDINEKIDEMQGSKEIVDNVLSKVENLATLENQLREPSQFRDILDNNKSKLDNYSKEMGKLLETYSNGVEAGQKFDKSVVNGKVEKFKGYEEDAKWIEDSLTEMEKEINNLKKLDDLQKQNEELQNEVNDLQRENDELENEVNDLQRQNEELQNEVDDLQSQNEKLQKENNNLQNQNNRIKKQNKELENKNAELQNRVESVPENPTEEPEQETGPELEREPEQETEPERETESEEDPLDRPEEMRVDNYLDNLYYSIEKLFNLTPDDRENENKIHELENSVMKIRTDIDNAFHNMDLSASQEMRLEDLHDRLNTLSREIERHKKTTKKNK